MQKITASQGHYVATALTAMVKRPRLPIRIEEVRKDLNSFPLRAIMTLGGPLIGVHAMSGRLEFDMTHRDVGGFN